MPEANVTCTFCERQTSGGGAWSSPTSRICLACVEQALSGLFALRKGGAVPLPGETRQCSFCGSAVPAGSRHDHGEASICGDCLVACTQQLVGRKKGDQPTATQPVPLAADLLASHFKGHDVHSLSSQVRLFPARMRADVQAALDSVLAGARVVGVRRRYTHETLEFPSLLARDHDAAIVGPLQYLEIDVGETEPKRCIKTALWLVEADPVRYVVLLSSAQRYGEESGLHIEIAATPGDAGARVTQQVFVRVEEAVKGARSYRGKVLSLEAHRDYAGRSTGIKVHRLRAVARDEVILPEKTLALLERNVFGFHARRDGLGKLGLSAKKGLLFHGPPGTGKTHTVHYLAGRLEGHTTLLITAEQVGLLDEYMALARLLEPSVVVVEDADLIARERTQMQSACEEVLLNKLLNEMDGLREDAAVMFILTTNRPDALEPALASRPGRIDQAIEFPLPDLEGRRKLVHLYARGLLLDDELVDHVARRVEGASAAFVKELMRRTAQVVLERSASSGVTRPDVESALEEMLFSGGQLNLKLLGGRMGFGEED